jgi:hypothetical protein
VQHGSEGARDWISKRRSTTRSRQSELEDVEDVLTTGEGAIHPICSGPAYEVSG